MRIFFAIDLPDDVKGRLVHVQDQWEHYSDGHHPAWTKRENLHLTLKFLGEVDDPKLANVLNRMKDLPTNGPFLIRTGAMQYFPPRGPIRILSVQLDGDTARLHQLAGALESLCELEGFPRERRPFNPHITIGRSRDGLPGRLRGMRVRPYWGAGHHEAKVWPDPSDLFPVGEVVLYESHLKPGGPEYIKLASFPV